MPTPSSLIRFGTFQLDLKAHELHKAGVKVKLQGQPFRVLALLSEHAGQVVTREELRQKVWPTDVYVDFDQGLNNAIKKVREALGDSAESPQFIETLARQGYRFIAVVNAVPPAPLEVQPDGKWRTGWLALTGATAAALLALLAYWAWHHSAMHQEKVILAVLPFDNLNHDPEQDFFSDGLTEEMIAQLGKLNPARLSVIARGSVTKYKGTDQSPNQIGRDLFADYLLQGSVRRAADRVRITVQLIRVKDQTDVWTESYDRELSDVLTLQASAAKTIAAQIHIALTPEEQTRLASVTDRDPEAYEAYLKGRYYWNKRTADGMRTALTYFQHAINKDPTYGAAFSGLADCSSGLAWHGFNSPAEVLPQAHAAALKAVAIDPQSAEAHASLALVLLHTWDWHGAEAEFKRAMQLDPHYANAHHWYGDYLSARGRHDEALREAKQALELDPLNLMIGTWVGLRYYLARQYERAITQVQSTVELDRNFAAARLVLGESYVQSGQREKGLAELQGAASLSGNSPLYLAQIAVALASTGRKSEALALTSQLEMMLTSQQYVSPYGLAQIHAALGDREQTFKWLQSAYDDRAVWMTYLAVDPVFDNYRSDPRFQDLLRKMGLAAQARIP